MVRSVYHETVHARLTVGLEPGLAKTKIANSIIGKQDIISEVVTYYKMVTNQRLPGFDPDCKWSSQLFKDCGKENHNLLQPGEWKTFLKKRYKDFL